MKIIQTETQWVCVRKRENGRYTVANWSHAYLKRDSIAAFISNSSEDWNYYKKHYGWQCIKVTVTIQTHSK